MGCGSSASAPEVDVSKPVAMGLIIPDSMKSVIAPDSGKLSEATVKKQVDLITNMVWKRYDSDGNGIIDAAEFTSLIGDVMCWDQINEDKPDPWEVKNFLQQIDDNGDGELDREEFSAFVQDGLALSDKERMEFATNSPMHARFMLFLENMLIVAETREREERRKA